MPVRDLVAKGADRLELLAHAGMLVPWGRATSRTDAPLSGVVTLRVEVQWLTPHEPLREAESALPQGKVRARLTGGNELVDRCLNCPYREGRAVGRKPLKKGENVTKLERQYAELIKAVPVDSQPVVEVEEELQEPYAGRIIQTYTTYSVSEQPDGV